MIAMILSMVMVFIVTACGDSEPASEEGDSTAAELTTDDIDALMWQIAEQEVELSYQDYLPDVGFANAEILGVDKEGVDGTAYAVLNTEEYVALNGVAYDMSGVQGPAIIRFEYTDDAPTLKEVVWAEDGEGQEAWLEENFPEEYLKALKSYEGYDENGQSLLIKALIPTVEKEMNVTVETENLLTNAQKKLEGKNADYIVANSIADQGAGFGVDTNKITILSHTGQKAFALMSKDDAAWTILKECLEHDRGEKDAAGY